MNRHPLIISRPVVKCYGGHFVVRDDLLPGGTKSRFIEGLFEGVDELVYASPAEGGAQTALALAAARLGKRFILFVAAREKQHERVLLSKKLGAKVVEIRPGYLPTVQARAREYVSHAKLKGRLVVNLEFGLDGRYAVDVISRAARLIPKPTELWFAAGSGTLARGLAKAWPDVKRYAVQVGHKLRPSDVGGAKIIEYWCPFSKPEEQEPPFPCDPHYDRKAYKVMLMEGKFDATFWNVAGPASSYDPSYIAGV